MSRHVPATKVRYFPALTGLVLVVALAAPAGAAPAAVRICATCHAEDGLGVGERKVPIIAAIPAVHIEEAIYAYKDGARECVYEPLMCEHARRLTDEEVADLAEHYSALPRRHLDESFDPALARRGEALHEAACSRCHVRPDDPRVADRLGPPLHGQRGEYLRYALESYLSGTRENLLPEMEAEITKLDSNDVAALVNYYVSF